MGAKRRRAVLPRLLARGAPIPLACAMVLEQLEQDGKLLGAELLPARYGGTGMAATVVADIDEDPWGFGRIENCPDMIVTRRGVLARASLHGVPTRENSQEVFEWTRWSERRLTGGSSNNRILAPTLKIDTTMQARIGSIQHAWTMIAEGVGRISALAYPELDRMWWNVDVPSRAYRLSWWASTHWPRPPDVPAFIATPSNDDTPPFETLPAHVLPYLMMALRRRGAPV